MTARQTAQAAKIKESCRKNCAALAVAIFILKRAKDQHLTAIH
jgi:hypothetical protein